MKLAHKLFSLLLILTITLGALVSCSDDDENDYDIPRISVETTEFALGAKDNLEATATININVEWTTSVSYEGENKDWLTVTPANGKSGPDRNITFRAIENKVASARKAVVTILYAGKTQELVVIQKRGLDQDITSRIDSKFAEELKKRGYIADTKKIMISDVEVITKLDVSGENEDRGQLTSLKGIEYFTYLTELKCASNYITSLDLSKNTNLISVESGANKITSLDVSNSPNLSILNCRYNAIESLDVSKNVALTTLYANDNKLTSIDVSKNTVLETLHLDSNPIENIDVSKNTKLVTLYVVSCKLSSLDVSKNAELETLECYYNDELAELDVTNNTKLMSLGCSQTKISKLDVTKNIALRDLHPAGTLLTSIDLSKNTELTFVNLAGCKLTSLDISNNKKLTSMYCSENPGVENKFVVKAWFDNNNVPAENFTNKEWKYEKQTVTLEYQKVN